MQQPTSSSTNGATGATSAMTSPPGEDRATTFQPSTGNEESVPGGNLLVAAYAIAWVVVLLVVIRVFRRQNELAGQIAVLEEAVEKARVAAGTRE